MGAGTKIGHGLAKFFNIKLQENEPYVDEVTRGESITSGSGHATETFIEQPVTVGEYFREITPDGHDVANYFKSLFPFLYWITKYNWIWFAGDLVAGESNMVFETVTKIADEMHRYHDRSHCRTSGYGLRQAR